MQRMLHTSSEDEPGTGRSRWLLFIYRVPSESSSARSAIWRETRRLGALSLQHGVCLVPLSDTYRDAVDRIARKVSEYGGEATILETASPDHAWQVKTVSRFNAARDEEYDEVIDECERFHEEIARERRKGKYTFAELEDEESNLERLRKYLGQVQARDAFSAEGQIRAVSAVEQCAAALETFAQDIYDRQSGSEDARAHE